MLRLVKRLPRAQYLSLSSVSPQPCELRPRRVECRTHRRGICDHLAVRPPWPRDARIRMSDEVSREVLPHLLNRRRPWRGERCGAAAPCVRRGEPVREESRPRLRAHVEGGSDIRGAGRCCWG